MFDDYVLYLVESLQSHDRYNELMSSVRGTRQLNHNNNNNNNSVNSSTTTRSINDHTQFTTIDVARGAVGAPAPPGRWKKTFQA